MRKREGFTLIELLVVIAIIAILAAILFPIFIRAKGSAQISKCLSNMKQIGSAMQMYLDDYDQRFPTCPDWGSEKVGNGTPLFRLLTKYTKSVIVPIPGAAFKERAFKSVGVFACPADAGLIWEANEFGNKKDVPLWPVTGCSYQIYGSEQKDYEGYVGVKEAIIPWTGLVYRSPTVENPYGKREGAPMSAIRRPSTKPMIGDISYWHAGDRMPSTHLARKNLVFCDGHAARVSYETYLKGIIEKLSAW